MLLKRELFFPGIVTVALIMVVVAAPAQAQFGTTRLDTSRENTLDRSRTEIDASRQDAPAIRQQRQTDFQQEVDARRTEQQSNLENRQTQFDTRQTDRQAESQARQADLESRRAELEDRRQELKTEAEAKKEEVRQQQAKKRAEVAAAHAQRVSTRFNAYFSRLNNIMTKIQSRIDKLEGQGVDVTRIQAKFDDALARLEAARSLGEEATNSFSSLPVDDFDTQKDHFESARTTALEAREAFRAALQSMRETVELIGIAIGNAQRTRGNSTGATLNP
ncbi:MAG: hypothetical protein COU69_00555 [Candidatus Pacebacteria bacterium CG10_big_fil_rev_8_21_14_0_10_56_10]|nr:MAG: hypothetical protein COU69_00555 [Candidatus Pacebacteria bacterium CG10_big_fil_rev_8_21_14_0_10_56_10]